MFPKTHAFKNVFGSISYSVVRLIRLSRVIVMVYNVRNAGNEACLKYQIAMNNTYNKLFDQMSTMGREFVTNLVFHSHYIVQGKL